MSATLPTMQVQDISRQFGGLQALKSVSIDVAPCTVHGIIGPNGAGKTTLFNIITGITTPDDGQIRFEDRVLPSQQPHRLVRLGVARTFQNIRLFKNMTVMDNVMIGQHVHTPTPILSILTFGRKAREGEDAARREALAALTFVGLEGKTPELVKNLPYGQQRLVEFARALAAKPRLLLLDEPAAGMNPTEKGHLLRLVSLLREQNYTVVLIEHDMKLVMNICDTVTVLDHGRKIAEGRPEYIRSHPDVICAYLGRGSQRA